MIADQNPVYGDNPYTVQYGKCGEPGSYIHLTPGYLTNDAAINDYGPRGESFFLRFYNDSRIKCLVDYIASYLK